MCNFQLEYAGLCIVSCDGDLLTASAGCGRRKSAVVKKEERKPRLSGA